MTSGAKMSCVAQTPQPETFMARLTGQLRQQSIEPKQLKNCSRWLQQGCILPLLTLYLINGTFTSSKLCSVNAFSLPSEATQCATSGVIALLFDAGVCLKKSWQSTSTPKHRAQDQVEILLHTATSNAKSIKINRFRFIVALFSGTSLPTRICGSKRLLVRHIHMFIPLRTIYNHQSGPSP